MNHKRTEWTIIYHTADTHVCPHIHKDFYEKSNPDANILYADGREYTLPNPYSSHKVKDVNSNCGIDTSVSAMEAVKKGSLRSKLVVNHDKFLRDWLRDNFHRITTDNIALYEWDVLLNNTLPVMEVNAIHVRISDGKHPSLGKVKKFNKNISKGMAPFGAFYANKHFIEQMIDVRYDYLYDQDLFCEARLTVLAHLTQTEILQDRQIITEPPGLQLNNIEKTMASVEFENFEMPRGCFHPIKKPIYVEK